MASTAQTWALIGIIGAFASVAMTMTVFSFQSLKGFIEAKIDAVDAKFEGRFDTVDRRLDSLDQHVQALTNRVFRERP